jgi:tRNA pseudouridine38-40 synthase
MRYFIEVSYNGAAYSGFQTQKNANTIQAEVEKALLILLKQPVVLTGSSRTDAGVHALQNFFHFDALDSLSEEIIYNLNAILPGDIVIKKIIRVKDDAHSRFDALSREYKYYIYQEKNPFLTETAYYYPYKLDFNLLNEASSLIKQYSDFTSFSKRNTQVSSFICTINETRWFIDGNCLVYNVKANRFLRGMVRALVATMLKVGTKKTSIHSFQQIIEAKDCTKASFSAPSKGLFLTEVRYPGEYFK